MKKIVFLTIVLLLHTYFAFGQCDVIDSLQSSLLRLSPTSKNNVNTLNLLAEEYAKLKNKQKIAYDRANQAFVSAQAINYPKGEAQALSTLGLVSVSVNPQSFEQARKFFDKAITLHKKSNDGKGLAHTLKKYGKFYYDIVFLKKEYLDSSAKYYELSYVEFAKLNNKRETAEVAGLAAEIFFEKGDDKKALEFSNKSIDTDDLAYNNAGIIQKSLQKRINAESAFRNVLIAGFILMGIFLVVLIRAIAQAQRANKQLQAQKTALAKQNDEINLQKVALEKSSKDLQEAFASLEGRNKEIDRQNKEILLQQTEIELRNKDLAEKNEEMNQQQEEIISQRDNIEKQAKELALQAAELQKSYETITILSRIGQSITSTLDFKEIFDTLYGYVAQLIPSEGFRIFEYHPESQELEYKFNVENAEKRPLMRVSMNEDKNPAVLCVRNMRSIMVNSKRALVNYGLDEYSINRLYNSMLYYPLLNEGKVIGAIGVYARKENAYSQHHLDTIKTLASYTSIALKNAETYEILNAAQAQLVESEKMAALGNLVAGVAHEINTPIGICVTASSRMSSKTKEFSNIYNAGKMVRKDLVEYLAMAEEGTTILMTNLTRAADLVQGFKRVAVEQTIETKRIFNLKTYLQETIMALNPELKNKPYHIDLDADEIEINSYAGAFSQILTNLVMNSLIHGFKNRDKGQMNIKAKTKNKSLILTYSDDGNGMTPEVLSKIYEPFFTTNRDGGGSGLGMNIVYNLAVQKLGGKLNAESTVGKGVTFVFEIPLDM